MTDGNKHTNPKEGQNRPEPERNDADEAGRREARKPTAAPGTGGLSSKLQPGGTVPGGGPGASAGSIGTGGGSTGGAPSGGLKRGGA
jgi:hypothetical protein